MAVKQARIGDLRHRITLQTLALASDGQGGQTETWTNLVTVWAYVRPISANERLFAQKIEPLISHEVIIRHRTDLVSQMRFIYDSRTFQVKAPFRPDERKFYIKFLAIEDSAT